MNLSLKWKVYLVGLVPFVSFLVISIMYPIQDNYSTYQEANKLKSDIVVIEVSSAIVHESQKERGKTASFLGGGASLLQLNEQRKLNDSKISNLADALKMSSLPKNLQNEISKTVSDLKELRSKVDSKSIELGSALKAYSGMIKKLLNIQLYVAENTQFSKLAKKIIGFRVLEDAKESGGKLRANIANILAKNKAISKEKLKTIISLHSGVAESMKSSALVLDDKSKSIMTKFNNSNEWAEVNSIYQEIISKYLTGEYGKDGGKFFKTITNALNILGSLIIYQKSELLKDVNNIQSQSIRSLTTTSIAIGVFFTVLFFFISLLPKDLMEKSPKLFKI